MEILLSNYRMPKKVEKVEKKTFRFSFIRRKIQTIFRSKALKTALLTELYGGKDAALVAKMVDKVPPLVKPPVQVVAPLPPESEDEEGEAATAAPANPPPQLQVAPANPPPPVQVAPLVRPVVQTVPAVAPRPSTSDGNTAATAVEISDTDSGSSTDSDSD